MARAGHSWAGGLAAALVFAARAHAGPGLTAAEATYADWLDATYAVSTLSSGALAEIDGRDLSSWQARLATLTAKTTREFAVARRESLDGEDARALARMRANLAEPPDAPVTTTAQLSAAKCDRAADPRLGRVALSAALYGCFERFGDHVSFQGRTIARATALELLQRLDDPGARRLCSTHSSLSGAGSRPTTRRRAPIVA